MPLPRFVRLANDTPQTITMGPDMGLAASGAYLDFPPGVVTMCPREVWRRQHRRYRPGLREVGPALPVPAPVVVEPLPEPDAEVAPLPARKRKVKEAPDEE
jgi:hypothetical protein